MLPHGDGLAGPEDAPTASVRERRPNQEQEQQLEQQNDLECLRGGEGRADQGGRADARRRRGLGISPPPHAEGASDPPAKRKRTPSRRVVEAAESALLLEEVIANEGFAARSAGQAHLAIDHRGAYDTTFPAVPVDLQWHAAASDFGDVSARVAALREALSLQQGQHGSSARAYESGTAWRQPFCEGSGGEGAFVGCSQQGRDPQFVIHKVPQRPISDAARTIPLCRRSRKELGANGRP